jgi:gag-polypeptide of LTR copia-type
MQDFADHLRSVGSAISDQDLIIYTLQGLGSEYETFVIAFLMCQYSPSMSELYSLLLAHEARIQANLKSLSTTSAHLLSSSQSHTDIPGSQQFEVLYTSGNYVRGNTNTFYNKNSGQYYRGRGSGSNRSKDRVGKHLIQGIVQCARYVSDGVTLQSIVIIILILDILALLLLLTHPLSTQPTFRIQAQLNIRPWLLNHLSPHLPLQFPLGFLIHGTLHQ